MVIFFSTLLHTRYLPYVSDLVDSAQQIVLVDAAVIIIASMFFKLDMGGSGFLGTYTGLKSRRRSAC